jgi:hypothetical protein
MELLDRKNFKHKDFFFSQTAIRLGINNHTTDPIILKNLSIVADKIQEIRDLLKFPIIINSSYRCLELNKNKAVGSKNTSQHLKGQAIDFICPKFGTPKDIFLALKKNNIVVDQCLLENTWIHLSIKESDNRNQFAKLINGKFEVNF